MGVTRALMVRWWYEHDEQALERLLATGALYSGTRDVKNVVAAYGEYLICKALGGTRRPQAGHRGDCLPPRGRVVEVKTSSDPRAGWNFRRYPLEERDYAVVRLQLKDWSPREAWLLPLAVARRFATGYHHRLAARGDWQAEARRLPLHRY